MLHMHFPLALFLSFCLLFIALTNGSGPLPSDKRPNEKGPLGLKKRTKIQLKILPHSQRIEKSKVPPIAKVVRTGRTWRYEGCPLNDIFLPKFSECQIEEAADRKDATPQVEETAARLNTCSSEEDSKTASLKSIEVLIEACEEVLLKENKMPPTPKPGDRQ